MATNGGAALISKEHALTFKNVSFDYGDTGVVKKSIFANLRAKMTQKPKRKQREKFILSEINLTIKHGEIVGVIGRNGAGKSTFLKMSSGILFPTIGEVRNTGKVAPMIELGAGFSMDFSARENILVYGCLMGNTRKEVLAKTEEILEWAELADFGDVPMRTFSTGMIGRVAFSAATAFTADLILIDEVLSVGDETFRNKSQIRVDTLLKSGAAVILVSHDLETIRKFSSRVIVLEKGKILFDGDSDLAISKYLEMLYE